MLSWTGERAILFQNTHSAWPCRTMFDPIPLINTFAFYIFSYLSAFQLSHSILSLCLISSIFTSIILSWTDLMIVYNSVLGDCSIPRLKRVLVYCKRVYSSLFHAYLANFLLESARSVWNILYNLLNIMCIQFLRACITHDVQ